MRVFFDCCCRDRERERERERETQRHVHKRVREKGAGRERERPIKETCEKEGGREREEGREGGREDTGVLEILEGIHLTQPMERFCMPCSSAFYVYAHLCKQCVLRDSLTHRFLDVVYAWFGSKREPDKMFNEEMHCTSTASLRMARPACKSMHPEAQQLNQSAKSPEPTLHHLNTKQQSHATPCRFCEAECQNPAV